MNKNLAQIVRILDLIPIPNADNIELAKVLGWQCVVKKNQFKINDLVIYFAIDSILPENQYTSFLKGERLKTKRIKGELSQGLITPLFSFLNEENNQKLQNVIEGDDVTDLLKVHKYIPTEELIQYDDKNNNNNEKFPTFLVPKTDSERIQNISLILPFLIGKNVIITEKEDGCSCTMISDFCITKKMYLCGRNYVWKEKNNNTEHYFEMEKKYQILSKLQKIYENQNLSLAIQAEIIGPRINKNHMKKVRNEIRLFDIWNIEQHRYLNYDEYLKINQELNLPIAPLIYRGIFTEEMASVNYLLNMANSLEYEKNIPAEGFVLKVESDINNIKEEIQKLYEQQVLIVRDSEEKQTNKKEIEKENNKLKELMYVNKIITQFNNRISFKVISNKFLEKLEKEYEKKKNKN